MDTKAVFAALYSVCEENATFFSEGAQGGAAQRLVDTMTLIQEHARSLEPVIYGFAAIYHHFDFDPHIPANGYRSLVKFTPAIRPCLQTIAIGLVAFGENYRRHQSGIGQWLQQTSLLMKTKATQSLIHSHLHPKPFY
ncbi:unnamed protein product, partial [Coregonus sp. 'balchen']